MTMFVYNRNNELEEVRFDIISDRISKLAEGLNVNVKMLAQETIANMKNKMRTSEIDDISAALAEHHTLDHPDYSILAARLFLSNLYKNTPATFSDFVEKADVNFRPEFVNFVRENAEELNAAIMTENDSLFIYSGLKVLEEGYLMKNLSGKIIERPQYMFMRVAIMLYMPPCESDNTMTVVEISPEETARGGSSPSRTPLGGLSDILRCYRELSEQLYIHATPTLFNAGTTNAQFSSCFLLGVEDSTDGIYDAARNAAKISKHAGGIGIHFHEIRAAGSLIRSTGGKASGIMPILKIFNDSARAFNQGGRRPGAFAIYLEPWHADIMSFLQAKLNQGDDSERARDLFYALWVPDLFMRRAKADEEWTLFDPQTAPHLADVFDGMKVCSRCGEFSIANPSPAQQATMRDIRRELGLSGVPCESEHSFEPTPMFTKLYEHYERAGLGIRKMSARKIQEAIFKAQRETGTPYVCYKDTVNRQSMHQNLGVIKSSNLCAEIMEYSTSENYATCTLASINLGRMYIAGDPHNYVPRNRWDAVPDFAELATFIDFDKLRRASRALVRNLNKIIDRNNFSLAPLCGEFATQHRPLAIGVQGMANLFARLRVPYDSNWASRADIVIAEVIYYSALDESANLGVDYPKFSPELEVPRAPGTPKLPREIIPYYDGITHFDLVETQIAHLPGELDLTQDWDRLRAKLKGRGTLNSLLVGFMPTASTSRILGNNDSFEPFSGNIYTSTTRGKSTLVNYQMLYHLHELGLWDRLRNTLISNGGSLASVAGVDDDLRRLYKTVSEIKQRDLIARAAKRGRYIDQSQSFNLYLNDNSNAILRSVMFAGWESGLKTGSYYIRSRPAVKPIPASLYKRDKPTNIKKEESDDGGVCYLGKPDCAACSG